MPVDLQPSMPVASGSFELADEGIYEVAVVDVEDAGMSPFHEGVRQVRVIFENEARQQIRAWMNYRWWSGKPQPSTLWKLAKAAGMADEIGSDSVPTIEQINSLIGRKVLVTVKHAVSQKGRDVAKVTDYNPVQMVGKGRK